jgi:DNA invertase Pin-like site-specific DNA recombinase
MSPKFRPQEAEKYVVYYRASTESQRDGLGLDAQKTAVDRFITNFGGTVVKEFTEIISGGSLNRILFNEAVDLAKGTNSTLLVHKVDRLSRSGFMTIALLEEQGVPFIEADAPHDSAFSKNIKFLVAKEERDKTKKRVKDALAEIKSNIEKNGYHVSKAGNTITALGSPLNNLSQKGRDKSMNTRLDKALNNPNNKRAISVLRLMKEDSSVSKMAEFLNDNGFLTSTGKTFGSTQVKNLLELYKREIKKL